MNYQTIIDKTAEIQHSCAIELSAWLERILPKVHNKQWWENGVVAKLSDEQRSRIDIASNESIHSLDLAALLRVLSNNRNDLLGRGWLQVADRTIIERMFGVRNRWAHIASQIPKLDIILDDFDTVEAFLRICSNNKELQKDVELFPRQLRDEGITDVPVTLKPAIVNNTQIFALPESNATITQGSIVRLKSDPTVKGAVMAVSKICDKTRYDVFVNGAMKPFYDGQIEIDANVSTVRTVSITELLQSLTAFQISKPSADSLYSLNAAKIDFVPYQFRPALKLIKSDEPRLLIADSVGVGKTIEAGLILKELQARSQLNNVLIICPKPLVAERKWEMEMKDKFGEDFLPVDGAAMRNILKDCDRDGEWSERYGRSIIPYSVLTNEQILSGFPYITGLKDLDPAPHFDLVIVDEAHHIRNSNTNAYKAVKYFCDHADAAIFLTATPLQLGSNDLYTLLNVLFPDKVIDTATFSAMTAPNPYINAAVRNLRLGKEHHQEAIELLKSAANTDWGRSVIVQNPLYSQIISELENRNMSRTDLVKLIDAAESLNSLSNMINRTRRIDIADNFCVRDAITVRSQFTDRQQQLHNALIEFEAQVLTVLHGGKGVKFMLSTLRHQAASCIFGLAPAIESLAKRGISAVTDSYDYYEPDFCENDANDIVGMAANLIELSKDLPEEDHKLSGLIHIIEEKQKQENNKIILFTTFKHTQRYLKQHISKRTALRVAIINGDTKDEERYNLRERFALSRENLNAIDILLFTEVGSEGLDYQFCDTMVNYDLPWNPMRIEQRIGRIDRRGQKSEKVRIYNCITDGTIDAEIFDRCLTRIGIFEQNIGDCSEILGELADGIEKIVFNSTLTPQERAQKLDKLAENEARNLLEIQRLENESKELFGIDISDFTDSLNRADNPWISANAVRRLVEGYLEKRINDGKKHLDGKLLRLSADVKMLLKDDYDRLGVKDKQWANFLKNGSPTCRITFEQEEAKNESKAIFVSATHVLARQAAKYFADSGAMQIALSVCSSEVPSGAYPFTLYAWEYQGERPRVAITPVCDNEKVQNEIVNLLQSAVQVEFNTEGLENAWQSLEEKHRNQWEIANAKYRADAQSLCRYKTESLTQSLNTRLILAKSRVIENIREGEIANIKADYEARVKRLENIALRADIHHTLLVNGVLMVDGGMCQ
jgi:SNF2 family DNA or RNA helicase